MPKVGKLTIAQQIINAVAFWKSLGYDNGAPRKKVGIMCGQFKGESGSYKNALRMLEKKKEWIILSKECIDLTDDGMKHADKTSTPRSTRDIFELIKTKFKSTKMKEILDILMDGEIHLIVDIRKKIRATNLTDASFNNIIGPLKTSGFVHKVKDPVTGKDGLQASKELFPFDNRVVLAK